jgi:hypothetical protein
MQKELINKIGARGRVLVNIFSTKPRFEGEKRKVGELGKKRRENFNFQTSKFREYSNS